MKNLITVVYIAIVHLISFSQTNIPQLVSFSAVVRDANNQPIVNTPVSIRLTFKEGGQSGPLVYCALHQDITNQNGFISIQLNRDVLGTGCNGAPSNAFEQIPWENGGFWMEVEYQTLPGSPFENLGQLELASSFYAFAAKTAEKIAGVNLAGANDGDVLTYNISSGEWEPMPASNSIPANVSAFVNDAGYLTTDNDQQQLSVSVTGDTLYLQNGGFVLIPGISEANNNSGGNSPVVITNPVTNITSNSATFSGSIPNANGNQIVQRGIVYSTSPNVDISDSNIYMGYGVGVFDTTTVIASTNYTQPYPHFLQPNTTYFARAYSVNQFNLITYGNEVSFSTYAIGQMGPGGGIVFYNKGNNLGGWQFLETSLSDLSLNQWGCNGNSIIGTSYGVGAGELNSSLVVSGCSDLSFASLSCVNLNQGGQTDWFLPSVHELFLMHKNLHINGIGNFASGSYWSSSESLNSFPGINYAKTFSFFNGYDSYGLKTYNFYVRAIRAY